MNSNTFNLVFHIFIYIGEAELQTACITHSSYHWAWPSLNPFCSAFDIWPAIPATADSIRVASDLHQLGRFQF